MPVDVITDERVRVPAEHRVLGLDKRSFPYALFVIAVFLVATVIVPRIDSAIDWDDPVRAGDELALSKDVLFTPEAGWNLEAGFRVDDDGSIGKSGSAEVISDGVTFMVEPSTFDGTASELLKQIQKVTSATSDPTFKVDGEPATLTTPGGQTGVIQTYSSVNGDGVVAALVIDGTGLEVTAFGPPAQMTAAASDIDAMIASIRKTPTQEASS